MPTTSQAKGKTVQEHPSGDPRFKMIDRALKRSHYQQDALIEVLHTAQETFGYLTEDLLIYVAQQLKLPPSWVYGVATFYHFFSMKPQGVHSCVVCLGTACYVKRASDIVTSLKAEYGVDPGQTTPDGQLSVSAARCVGSCGLAPVVVIDGAIVGKEAHEATIERVRKLVKGGSNGSTSKTSIEEAKAS